MTSEDERSESSENASGRAASSGDRAVRDSRQTPPDGYGTLYVVGIGPGLPHAMTQRAKDVIETADCVIASNLYQEFLEQDGTIPAEAETDGSSESATARPEHWTDGTVVTGADGTEQEIVRSSMGQQVELTREAFDRVRAGQDVAHVSGGDPNVYGKSDLVFLMADEEAAEDIPIEIVPGVTAALGGAANLGAPLSNDFCTISLSDKWRGWEEIEEKLRAAAISGFVIVLYNCWRDHERAIDVIREERSDDVPVAIFNDAGRGEAGRNLEDETHTITTLGETDEHADEVGGMGTSILVGTAESHEWTNDYENYLVTPRGGREVEDF